MDDDSKPEVEDDRQVTGQAAGHHDSDKIVQIISWLLREGETSSPPLKPAEIGHGALERTSLEASRAFTYREI